MRKIIIACPIASAGSKLQRVLLEAHINCGIQLCRSGGEALQTAGRIDSGVVICCKICDMPASELARLLPQTFDVIALLSPGQSLGAAISNLICFNLPLNRMEFLNTVNLLAGTDVSIPKCRSSEEEKKISVAKRILMDKHRLSERGAYNMLRRRSMDSGERIAETAQKVLNENF